MRRKEEGRKIVTGMLCGAILLGVSIALTACGKATEAGATLPGTTVGATTKAGPETAKPETEKEETTTAPEQATEELSAATSEGADDDLGIGSYEQSVLESLRWMREAYRDRAENDLIVITDNPYTEEAVKQETRNLLENLETTIRTAEEIDTLLEAEGFLAVTTVEFRRRAEIMQVLGEEVKAYYDPALVREVHLFESRLSIDDEEREKQLEKIKEIAARAFGVSVDEIQLKFYRV